MLHKGVGFFFWFHKLKVSSLSFIFKQSHYSFFKKINKKLFPKIEAGNFVIKLAETSSEIKNAQSLRYSVFYKEKNAKATLSNKILSTLYL